MTRRRVLAAGASTLAASAIVPVRASRTIEIRMKSDRLGAKVWFDPIGLFVEPGATVRWVVDANVHTTTAYHPDNDGHPLRIPEAAQPWDSGFLVNPGDDFSVMLTVEGVYDYFCTPHEQAGMVGRIIVGRASGPGSRPFDYFEGQAYASGWRHVPPAARDAFPPVERILSEKIVRVA